MNDQLGVMIDLEQALYLFTKNDLYSAGIAFFSALGYPIVPLETAINESVFRFVYVLSKNRCTFGSDETDIMRSVASISWLFTLSNDIPALYHIQNSIIGNVKISSINYFCVELDCTLHDRSIQAFNLTKIIGKVVNTPVVVLFRHLNSLALSSVFMVNTENTENSKTYLSDWYPFYPIQEDLLMILSNWHYGNYCDDNFHTIFMDLVHFTARPYFLYSESHESLKYGRNSIVVLDRPIYDEIVVLDGVSYILPAELTEQIVELNPRDFYEYDYVNNEESFEIITDDPEWILEELFNIDDIIQIMDDVDFDEDEEEYGHEDDFDNCNPNNEGDFPLSDQKSIKPDINIDNIDDVIFKNPIKMLEYLESLDQKGK